MPKKKSAAAATRPDADGPYDDFAGMERRVEALDARLGRMS